MANIPAGLMLPWMLCFLLVPGIVLHARPEASTTSTGPCKSGVLIYGYQCQEHSVATDDGYILSIIRIRNGGSKNNTGENKIPVLLQHGIFLDGLTWLMNPPDESLSYMLADNEFDVWIPNNRGTVYSRGHISLSPSDPAYWNWSWDELAQYELPAIFEYVYSQTNQQRIHYVGHSEGTLIALAALTEQKVLDMVKSVALLCPVWYMKHIPSPVVRGATYFFIGEVARSLGIQEFIPVGKAVRNLLKQICEISGPNCADLLFIGGPNCCLKSSTVEVFLEHELQPTATKNFIHFEQMIRTGMIAKYDYNNIIENMKYYGQSFPPAYNISAIPDDLPLFFGYGGRDALSGVIDVEHLLDDLKFHKKDKLVTQFVPFFAHWDFLLGSNANRIVYDHLIVFFQNQ